MHTNQARVQTSVDVHTCMEALDGWRRINGNIPRSAHFCIIFDDPQSKVNLLCRLSEPFVPRKPANCSRLSPTRAWDSNLYDLCQAGHKRFGCRRRQGKQPKARADQRCVIHTRYFRLQCSASSEMSGLMQEPEREERLSRQCRGPACKVPFPPARKSPAGTNTACTVCTSTECGPRRGYPRPRECGVICTGTSALTLSGRKGEWGRIIPYTTHTTPVGQAWLCTVEPFLRACTIRLRPHLAARFLVFS